jgi:hypothetical protein
MKLYRIIVLFLNCIVGIFGLLGGYAAFSTPQGPFGISTDVLKNGPFTDFFIPGLTLFIVIGIGHIATAIMVLRKVSLYPYIEGAMAAITVGWIVIQCWIMQEINAMHVAIFCIGIVQGFYVLVFIIKNKIFPYKYLHRVLPWL